MTFVPDLEPVFNYTVGIYYSGPLGKPSLCGSGVYLKIGDTSFLASAAHVLEKIQDLKEFFVPARKDFIGISGEFTVGNANKKDNDIGIIKLTPESIALLDSEYINLESMLPPVANNAKSRRVFISGFPRGRSIVNVVKRHVAFKRYDIESVQFLETKTTPPVEKPIRLISLAYPKKRKHGEKMPKAEGISGGPVSEILAFDGPEYYAWLMALNVACEDVSENTYFRLIAIKSIMINSLLMQQYPELGITYRHVFGRKAHFTQQILPAALAAVP